MNEIYNPLIICIQRVGFVEFKSENAIGINLDPKRKLEACFY
jgi:hypothetical protein